MNDEQKPCQEPVAAGSECSAGLGASPVDQAYRDGYRTGKEHAYAAKSRAEQDELKALAELDELRVERDRYMRALVHIRANAESQLRAFETCARIAGEFVETQEFINARWNYTEANAALSA